MYQYFGVGVPVYKLNCQHKKKVHGFNRSTRREKKEDPGTSDIPKESTGFFPNWLVDQRSYTTPCSRTRNSPTWKLDFSLRLISQQKCLAIVDSPNDE
jgi:hypothetical protein